MEVGVTGGGGGGDGGGCNRGVKEVGVTGEVMEVGEIGGVV